MFREMRRKKQQLNDTENRKILERNTTGVLSMIGDDGYPYGIPLNYVLIDDYIYFHGAKTGHKIDSIRKNEKVSFTVVDLDRNIPEKFTTYFKSLIIFGHADIVSDDNEKRIAVTKLADKFSPNEPIEEREAEINREWKALSVIRLSPVHMTGKQAIELVTCNEEKDAK